MSEHLPFEKLLRILARKNAYDILELLNEKSQLQYSQIRDSVNLADYALACLLGDMSQVGILERTVLSDGKRSVIYKISQFGSFVYSGLLFLREKNTLYSKPLPKD